MATKLQRIEKGRPSRQGKGQNRLPPFNQTIIINNPNININYLNGGDSSSRIEAQSSKGLDSWHLNNNLKEFGETRQLGFFKGKRHNERNKSNSPYIIHKVRTQDLKSVNKIYGSKQMKDTLSNFRKNETLEQIVNEVDKVESNTPSVLERILSKQEKTITDKFYPQPRRNHRIQLQKNFQTLPTSLMAAQSNPENHPKTFRKNRFQVAADLPICLTQRKPAALGQETLIHSGSGERRESGESQQGEGVRSRVPNDLRKRVFSKAIENINKCFLRSTDEYLDRTYLDQLPQAEIEICINSLSHPEHISRNPERPHKEFYELGELEFQFEEERKRRPKTPKRKKQYETTF